MAVYRLPFDNSNGGWSMPHGNFDDPVYGHGVGQAFAWDFVYNNAADPDGTKWGKIYAARAGTVIDVRDGITTILSGTGDPALGAGNYMLIRHADDTISAYDHLKANSIVVSVGQYVEQGTWLAIVGNTGNTYGTVHCHFECHTWYTVGSVGTPVGGDAGASLLVHFEDGSHTAWRPVDGDSFGGNPLQYRQDGWQCCYKCAGLYFSYQGSSGVCPADATPHATTGGNYTLSDDANAPGQPGWMHCRKCSGLFFADDPTTRCPVTVPTNSHDPTGSNIYRLISDVQNDPGQHHWRWCPRCQGLWFGDAATSACPANEGGPHSLNGSGDYSLALNLEDSQQNWRLCNKCRGLFFAPNGVGVCKGGGGHSSVGSLNYTLYVDLSPVNSAGTPQASVPPSLKGWQGGWRFCNKCGLLWMGLNSGSHCPATGSHSSGNSGDYYLWINDPTAVSGPGQLGWRWCHKCQGFWMGLNSGSKCSADDLAHSSNGSGNYAVSSDTH